MGKGKILRILEDTVLPSKVSKKLDELMPGYELETYQPTPNYKRSITRRIESLYNAFLFVLDSYPLNPKFTILTAETLKAYAAECKAACDLNKDSLDELHKELEKFTAKLVDTLSISWHWPDGKPAKEAIACLNEAECYQLMMSHGRPDLATLTTIEKDGETEYVLQLDESIPPHYDQILEELTKIKAAKYPKTPSWFRKLPEYQQAYFCNLNLETIGYAEVVQDFNKFLVAWESIKDKSLNLTTELKKIQSSSPPYASWYNELSAHLKEMVKILAVNPVTVDNELKQFKLMLAGQATKPEFKNSLKVISAIPQWYWVTSNRQQHFLEHVLKNAPKVEDAVSFVSSRLRTLPLPSNLAAHRLLTINAGGELITHYDKRYRSSHIVSRDALHLPAAVQSRHSDSNFSKVMEKAKPELPSMIQTLISPILLSDYVPTVVTDYLPELPPDLALFRMARSAVGRSKRAKDIWQHNHPFNIAKLYYYTQPTDSDSLALLESAEKYVKKIPELRELLDDYKKGLESPFGSATFWDYDGRELYLSSLEQLIILTIGGYSYGSCVSGKDRKALELLHTDSMILYKYIYGSWPKFGDPKEKKEKEERTNFVSIFVGLYVSRHQHEHAGQNAPGSEGTKTPNWYLPKDIADAINNHLGTARGLEFDDRLATDNEVKNISHSKTLKKYLLPAGELYCKLLARQLGEVTCTKLYDALSALVNETRKFHKSKETWTFTWHKKEVISTPTGIELIRRLMRDEKAGDDNIHRIGAILAITLDRPVTGVTRSVATNSVYDRMRDLLKPKVGVDLQVIANTAIKEWGKLFEESKVENITTLTCQF